MLRHTTEEGPKGRLQHPEGVFEVRHDKRRCEEMAQAIMGKPLPGKGCVMVSTKDKE